VVRRGRRGAIYSRNEAVRGKIFVLTGAPARSRWLAGIPAAGDGIARAERQEGSSGDRGGGYLPSPGGGSAGRGAAAACPR
jgi:hypothetical protein